MGDERIMETPHPGSQVPPSWLDWEISPELSFGSVTSSIDEKSLSGSLDPNSFCSNSDCLSVRIKYEQLVERIKKFLLARRADLSVSNTSTPRVDVSDMEKEEISGSQSTPDLSGEADRFVENTDPEIPMLQRITSIHLEHSVRVPFSESTNLPDRSCDQFVVEGVTDAEVENDDIIKQIVNDSKTSYHRKTNSKKKTARSKQQEVEGHFSENEFESETEEFSESSVTIEYDQFDSYDSVSGTGVTNKNVHPFNECTFAKSVIRRHMSENEISDDDELLGRKRCLSDSGITSDRESVTSFKTNKENMCSRSEGQFVHERKTSLDEADTLDLTQVSGFETIADEVFDDSDRSSIIEIIPSERVSRLELGHSKDLTQEQDKFIAEMSPGEENPPGSAACVITDDRSNTSKATGEDQGDFFEEVIPVVRRKSGRPLLNINLKLDSYSLDIEELGLATFETDILSIQNLENSSSVVSNSQEGPELAHCQTVNRLPLSEELRHASISGSPNMFVGEEEENDPDDMLGSNNSSVIAIPPPVTEGKQSYENTVFDVLNSICPGTNPRRVESEENVVPVIQNFEKATQDFSEFRTSDDIQELHSQIQSLETELSTLKMEHEYLNKKLKKTESLKTVISELKEKNESLLYQHGEQLEELEKINFLKENFSVQLEKLRKENDSLHQLNLQSKEQIEKLKKENDNCSFEFRKLEKEKSNEEQWVASIAELELDKQKLEKSVLDLKRELEERKNDVLKIKLEKDEAVSDKNNFQANLNMLMKDYENKELEMKAENQCFHEQITSLSNQITLVQTENTQMQEYIQKVEEMNKIRKQEFIEELSAMKQKNTNLMSEIEDLSVLNKLEKETLNEKIKSLEEENGSLREQSQVLKQYVDKVNTDTEELIKQFEIKIAESKQFEIEVGKLRSSVHELNERLTKCMEENSLLIERNKTIEEEMLLWKENYKMLETEKISFSEKMSSYEQKCLEQNIKIDELTCSLCDKEKEIECFEEKLAVFKGKTDVVFDEPAHFSVSCEKSFKLAQPEMSDNCIKNEPSPTHDSAEEIRKLQSVNDTLELSLKRSREINEENEWAINELAVQVEELEKEKVDLHSKVELMSQNMKLLKESHTKDVEKLMLEKNMMVIEMSSQAEKLEALSDKSVLDDNDSEFDKLKMELRKAYDEKSELETQLKVKSESAEHENKELSQRLFGLEKEKSDLDVLIRYNRETFDKEKSELLEMYNDLKNEVDTLIETKKYLEDELCTLKELLENGFDMKECDTSRELTIEDLEEMQELKNSIETLKKDMKEKDHYVRKLEEHLLNLDGGLPDITSATKPTISLGEPIISKSFSHKHLVFSGFGRQAHHSEKHDPVPSGEVGVNPNKMDQGELDHSALSESKFAAELASEGKSKFTSSFHSDIESVPSRRDSFDTSDRIRSGLKAEEDGHYALELKQFELVDEITKLRKDFRETKAIYEQETALLTEALEREKTVKENVKTNQNKLTDEINVLGSETTALADLVRARQDIALLRKENNILRMENERWLNRIKEQEQIVLDLRERLTRNTSGIEEIEEVFGRQLALLQKQREELLDQIRNKEQENNTLSVTLGEKSIIEDSLRREKDILSSKLQDKSNLEKELHDKQLALEKQKLLQKQFEEVIYQKDINERNLMKQKRLLEEELLEIESKVRDREENLGFEKNQLLDELRDKNKKTRSETSEPEHVDDVRSVCSDGSISDQQIGRLEVMLEEVEKQHKRAVNVLRDQLQSKYDRRAKALREEHAGALSGLHLEHKKQVT